VPEDVAIYTEPAPAPPVELPPTPELAAQQEAAAAAALTIDEQVLKGSGDATGSADPTSVEGQATTEATGATPADGQATTDAADADPSTGDGV
jgi:hypothetical protein